MLPDRSVLESTMKSIITRMIDPPKVDMVETVPVSDLGFSSWNWPQGVGLNGLFKVALQSQDAALVQVLVEWYETMLKKPLPRKNVNAVAPLIALSQLCKTLPRPEWITLCDEWADWVMKDMPRTREQGLQHIVVNADNPGQLWVDTLYMTGLFLASMGMLRGKTEYIEEASRQFLLHIKYLQDRKTGLFFHGWTFEGNHNFGAVHWGRGNCWFTAAVPDFLEMTGVGGAVREFLVQSLKSQVEALIPLQDSEGLWHTVLDDPDSYAETSATAGFGYGILKSVRLGLLPESFRASGIAACKGVLSRVDATGIVTGVSYGTAMGDGPDFYKSIPVCPTAYGQALAVHLLEEAARIS